VPDPQMQTLSIRNDWRKDNATQKIFNLTVEMADL
jgi:hypothetical protein